MYLSRKQKGFGWYAKVKSKDMQGKESTAYVQFAFKKGCEPTPEELNQNGSVECDLLLVESGGKQRRVFPIARTYTNQSGQEVNYVEFMIMDYEFTKGEPIAEQPVQNGLGSNLIDPDDLPFY
jgi:hypothetical protein